MNSEAGTAPQFSFWPSVTQEERSRACDNCHETKPLTGVYFCAHEGYRGGFDNLCRTCRNEYKRSWYQAKRAERKAAAHAIEGSSAKCIKCEEVKALTKANFYATTTMATGWDNWCRSCRNAIKSERRERNKDQVNAITRSRWKDRYAARAKSYREQEMRKKPIERTARNLVAGIRGRSRKFGYAVSPELLDRRFVEEWLRRQPACECCGKDFVIGQQKSIAMLSPSFDRFDTSGGYELHNTALVCWRCNNIKRNYEESDLRTVADWMERRKQGAQYREAS